MAVDGSGNVVVTGWVTEGGAARDYYTATYASIDGALLWEKRYNGPGNRHDSADAVALDSGGNVVVTGHSSNETNNDYYTAKYAAADGTLLWEQRYNGPANGEDHAYAVAVDGSGNVMVTGNSYDTNSYGDFYTAKYAAADGALLWEKRYNGPANARDVLGGTGSHSLALGPNGMVAITGSSSGDYVTVVYRENLLPAIICPANRTMNATGSAGTVITFTVTVTDDSGVPPTTVCVPPSGSVFPVGQTTVTCTATDSDAETNNCSFTVTVLSARSIKENLLAELISLRATVTDRNDRRQLAAAIRHLTRSLAPALWVDDMHLSRLHGERVFHQEKLAARQLCRLLQRHISLPFVPHNFPTEANRLLAVVAIEDAITAGLPSDKIKAAQRLLARGDGEVTDTKCYNGIEEYRKAWKHATR